MTVHRFLVTADVDPRLQVWAQTAPYANWIEGRENKRGGDTFLVTVFAAQGEDFLSAARDHSGVTVEEIEGAGDTETYVLRVGEEGTGWLAT